MNNTESVELIALRKLCDRKRLNLFISSPDLRRGNAHIHLKKSGMTLASFHDPLDAANWIKPEGKP